MRSRIQIMILRFCLIVAVALAAFAAGCARHGQPSYLVYVTNEASGDLTVIDPGRPEAVATVPLGKRPRGLHAAGGFLYVALSGSPFAPPGADESTLPPPDKSADGIGVVDLRGNKLLRKIASGSDPEQFDVGKDGKLYVSNEDVSGLSIVDPASGQVLTTLATGEEPEGVTLSPDGKFVYVTSENEGMVTVVDTAAAKVVKNIKVGRRPRSVVFLPDGSRAFVTNENDASLTVIDAMRQEALRAIPLGAAELKPMGMAMTGDGAKLYVSTGRGKKVLVVDTASEKVTASVEVGQRPWGIALSPDEKLLFTANGPSNDVTVVEAASLKIVRKVKAGDRPWGVIALAQ